MIPEAEAADAMASPPGGPEPADLLAGLMGFALVVLGIVCYAIGSL